MGLTVCYHCGDDCGKQIIAYNEKAFCCSGCKTVYEIFSENDLDGYYDLQVAPCLLYTSPSPRDVEESRMPSSA